MLSGSLLELSSGSPTLMKAGLFLHLLIWCPVLSHSITWAYAQDLVSSDYARPKDVVEVSKMWTLHILYLRLESDLSHLNDFISFTSLFLLLFLYFITLS